jgi:hypothetical protein
MVLHDKEFFYLCSDLIVHSKMSEGTHDWTTGEVKQQMPTEFCWQNLL